MLIVPYGSDVERIERELLARRGALLCGRIGTFDDLFERLARDGGANRPVVTDAQRQLIVRTAVSAASLNGLGALGALRRFRRRAAPARSASSSRACVEPADLEGDLARLYGAYRAELDRLELWDRDLQRRYAAERVAARARVLGGPAGLRVRLRGPDRRRVGAAPGARRARGGHGLAPVRAEPRRVRFAPPDVGRPDGACRGPHRGAAAPLRRDRPGCPRAPRAPLFSEQPPAGPELDGSVRFLEGAGARGTLELVAEEVLELIRGGTAARGDPPRLPEPRSPPRARSRPRSARSAFRTRSKGESAIGRTAFGKALFSLLRFEWLGGDRHDLYGFLRSPFSGLPARTSTISRGGCAAGRSTTRSGSSRRR